ncbi:MAG: hypothetical protein K1060chlam1_00019 [Candidatus Anoxychlamydiales bacterium]|nr:hypothetical protein [Candidatus Anoxychlamydiales bacterium]
MTADTKRKKEIDIDKKENLFEIEPIFFPPSSYDLANFESFVNSFKTKLIFFLPKNIIDDFKEAKTTYEIKNAFYKMNQSLPYIFHSELNSSIPFSISFSVFSISDLTGDISRFTFDMLNKWLILSKPLDISANRSIKFKFKNFTQKKYSLSEYFINVSTEKEKSLIERNISSFINEMKLIIMSAIHTKEIISLDTLTSEKSNLLKEDSSYISDINHKNKEDMKHFILKFSEEKKLNEIKENLAFLMSKKPKIFDKDIFDSLHIASLIFKGDFTSIRGPKHVSKIIALSYYFKKSIMQIKSQIKSSKRHVKLKILKTNLLDQKKAVLGILIVIDLLHENEYFEKNYILDSIAKIIKNFKYVKNSYITDRRDLKILTFYLEIAKEDFFDFFSLQELKDLKKKLKLSFSSNIKKLINPIFSPRNEEEILRNIIILTKQLNYVKDIPQVIISYDKQTSKEISFIVILLRLIKKNTSSLKEIFSYSKTFLKFSLDESKIVGVLKKKYPKEANVFKISLNKFEFLRNDFSLDLRKARQTIYKELTHILGKFRDFNGGLLAKQLDALESLKQMLPSSKKIEDFLLEEFFYSIKPAIQQSIIDTKILKNLFLMFLKILKRNFENKNFLINTKAEKNNFYIMIKTHFTKIKEDIILAVKKQKFKSFEIIFSSLDKNDQKTLGFILISKDQTKKEKLYQTIINEIEKSFKI